MNIFRLEFTGNFTISSDGDGERRKGRGEEDIETVKRGKECDERTTLRTFYPQFSFPNSHAAASDANIRSYGSLQSKTGQ